MKNPLKRLLRWAYWRYAREGDPSNFKQGADYIAGVLEAELKQLAEMVTKDVFPKSNKEE
jgi:hypothetical protein